MLADGLRADNIIPTRAAPELDGTLWLGRPRRCDEDPGKGSALATPGDGHGDPTLGRIMATKDTGEILNVERAQSSGIVS